MGVPDFNSKLLRLLASEIPVSTILVFLEHIAISKVSPVLLPPLTFTACANQNNFYSPSAASTTVSRRGCPRMIRFKALTLSLLLSADKIDPNQELVAIGVNNIFSSFFGACELPAWPSANS